MNRVGEEHSVHPNPLGPIGDPPSVSNDTDREVAALKAQVGDLTRMFRAFLAQQMPVTPPSLSAASASSEVYIWICSDVWRFTCGLGGQTSTTCHYEYHGIGICSSIEVCVLYPIPEEVILWVL